MKGIGWKYFAGITIRRLFFFIVTWLLVIEAEAQCDPLVSPSLFGPSTTSIYCKNQNIQIGVFNSRETQTYTFSLYRNGLLRKKKGGPLTGNGSTLSVAAAMRTAQDAGEYRIVSYDACGNADSTSYFAYYGAIDNLSIVTWGSNNVKFNWASSSPVPVTANSYVTYNYVVTTRANANLVHPDSILSTIDTFAAVTNSSLVAGRTYYIHVRVDKDEVLRNGNFVSDELNCSVDGSFTPIPLPWQTVKFVACSGAAPTTGTVTPVNAVVCNSSTVTLTGSAALTHKWYKDTTLIAGATLTTYNTPDSGQFRHYVTITGTACQGMVATATVQKLPARASDFFSKGGNNLYAGDTVRLGIDSTIPGQTYKILKDGVEVYSMLGIGYREVFNEGPDDTIWYKFVITSASQAGLYTVRTTSPDCSDVDFGNVQINFITGVTVCPTTNNTSFTFSSPGNNTSFQWQVAVEGSSTFNPVSNGGIYGGATTNTLTITNAASTLYGNQYRCVASGGVGVTSSVRTLKFGVTWDGSGGTAWATAANWSCNTAPNANTDVIIEAGTGIPNQPIITTNVTVRSVLVKPGATLNVNTASGKLTITGQ